MYIYYDIIIQHFMPDRIRNKVYTIHINTTYDNNNPLF